MLEIHLYGKFREKAPNSSPSDNSVIMLPYEPDSTLLDVLKRLNIDPMQIGDCFIDGHLATPESRVPSDNSRIGVFPLGMHLIDGGLWIKHNYWDKEP